MIGYGHFFITNDETVTYFRDEMGVIFVLGHYDGCQTSTGIGLMFQHYHTIKEKCFAQFYLERQNDEIITSHFS